VYMLAGSGQLKLGARMVPLKQGDAIYIPKGLTHSFRNTGDSRVEVIQIYSPAGPEERFRNWKTKQPQ
jgi:putative monooxygenase